MMYCIPCFVYGISSDWDRIARTNDIEVTWDIVHDHIIVLVFCGVCYSESEVSHFFLADIISWVSCYFGKVP